LVQKMSAAAKGYQFWLEVVTGEVRMWMGDGVSSGIFNRTMMASYNDNVWRRLMITYDGSGSNTGLNLNVCEAGMAGAPTLIREDSLDASSLDSTDMQFGFNATQNDAFFGVTGVDSNFDGWFDEHRMSKGIVRSDDYANTVCSNQYAPSTFFAFGPEVTLANQIPFVFIASKN